MPGEGKTEKPTPRRLERAKQEGNVPKSPDVNSVAVLLTGLLLLWLLGEKFFSDLLMASFYAVERFISPHHLAPQDLLLLWGYFLKKLFVWISLIFLIILAAAVIANIAQFGFIFSFKPLKPKLEKLNPINGLKNLFFSLNSLFELVKSIVKIAVIIAVAYFYLKAHLVDILSLYRLPLGEGLLLLGDLVFKLSLYIAATGAVIAAIDYGYKRWKWIRDLMMTKEELKEEFKQTEGNPEVRREIRRRMRQIMSRRMLQEVPKATVVITNPIHFAVALKYDMERDRAPKVVAKGVDHLALKIVEIAKKHGVEIYRDPPLARALYQAVDVGDEIPEQFYRAVAHIIAYILRKKRELGENL